ncbi:MAG TPA: polymer-forming cytoskeletal protein [Rhodocyclaceae bacterium]|nr:polymer-forming cytoskeletal protein [Rhodocyclaceae bacterium]
MFGKKKDSFIELTKLSSLVASNVDVTGDLSFVDGLRIDGQVRGNVQSRQGTKSLLVLSDQGSITGNVRSHDAIINGVIVGDLEVEHFLELQGNARITGNITYRQLRMDCGASVDGKLNKVAEGSDISNVVELPGNGNAATA